MSLSLKPLTINSNSKILDARQKRFESDVEKSLQYFDTVTEWADYIANLGKLLKALQSWSPQFQNVKYYVPSPYQVSRRLTSSLSPNLPAGVHQKTLEVYTFIFEKIGQISLSEECNIWIPGILPLMAYASMSVKSQLIELYDNFLVQLNTDSLKIVVRPLLASMLPGIDDESSEFQPHVLNLIETLKERLSDDSLFWQTCFLIIISSKEHRLGGIVWLIRKFPSLNAVPHLVKKEEDSKNPKILDKKLIRERALATLLPGTERLITPESGLLIRALVCCLREDNDLLIKRGVLDLLLQRLHLDSPILDKIVSPEDKRLLLLGCCRITLNKDMSLNRRVWNWLLGPIGSTSDTRSTRFKNSEDGENINPRGYFIKYGLNSILISLKSLVESEELVSVCFNVCISLMDRWEIASLIIPEMFLPLLLAAQEFVNNSQIISLARSFFNSVETNLIWGKCYIYFMESRDFEFLDFVLATFNISEDEDIIVRHLPFILLSVLALPQGNHTETASKSTMYTISKQLLAFIPERAFLPLSDYKLLGSNEINYNEFLENITKNYQAANDIAFNSIESNDDDISSVFNSENFTMLIANRALELLIQNIESDINVCEMVDIFLSVFERIPEYNNENNLNHEEKLNNQLIALLPTVLNRCDIKSESVYAITKLYSRYLVNRVYLLASINILKLIVDNLWGCLLKPQKQLGSVKCLEMLDIQVPSGYIEEQLAHCFMKEQDISNKCFVLDLLWNHLKVDSCLINRSLELLLDDLFDEQNTHYLYISKWILSINNSGTILRLFDHIVNRLSEFEFLRRDNLNELDDLDNFTYRIQVLTNVLKTNNRIVLENFSSQITDIIVLITPSAQEIQTYKKLVISILLKFLEMNNNIHVSSVRSSLDLLDNLLDGSEDNFKEIVILLLGMSSTYISQGSIEAESIAVSLVNIVSKVFKISHENHIKLDIFDDNATHLKYLDYLVTSVTNMEGPLIITAYVDLLLGSISYFENSVFRMIVPLTGSIVQCIEKLFLKENNSDKYAQSIILMLEGLEKLLVLTHEKLVPIESDGYSGGSDFLQSMVSNVFLNDNTSSITKIQGERDVILQSFKQVIYCCQKLWSSTFQLESDNNTEHSDLFTFSSQTLKSKSLKLASTLFALEPLDILETIINVRNNDISCSFIVALNEQKSGLVIPYLFYDISLRCNKNTSIRFSVHKNPSNITKFTRNDGNNKLKTKIIIDFLLEYLSSTKNIEVEEFYHDFIIFVKSVAANYNCYNGVWSSILKLYAVVALNLSKLKFGEQQNVRKEISDTFTRYLPNALSALSDENEADLQTIYNDFQCVLENLKYVINEDSNSDRYAAINSTIVTIAIYPYFKKQDIEDIPPFVFDLAQQVSKTGSSNKSWNILVNELFQDDKRFLSIKSNKKIQSIISGWSQYPDNKTKLITNMLLLVDSKSTGLTPALISFNSWNVSEVNIKCLNLLRISYLIMSCSKNTYILNFQSLISCVCQYLVTKELKLKSTCWILLRALLLKFSSAHFNDYWSMISYCLQTNLQEFLETSQIQGSIDTNNILQMCKTLDLLLTLNFDGFSATNEWIFVIDTVNCVGKTEPYMSLIDTIAGAKEYVRSSTKAVRLEKEAKLAVPLLFGVHKIDDHTQLRNFFQKLSYMHYKMLCSLKESDWLASEEDVMNDIFIQ